MRGLLVKALVKGGIQVISTLKAYIPRKGGFISNVLTLVTGTSVAQAITVAATPILTRLYSPEEFGLLALFLSVTNIITVVASWRYDLAIVLPKADREGINVLVLAALITLGMSGLCFWVVAFWHEDIARLMNAPNLAPWLWWAPVSLLLSGIFQALTYWNTRKKQFSLQALAQVGKSVGASGTQIGAGLLTSAGGGAGLILGTVAGELVGTGFLGERVWRQQKQLMTESVSLKTLWEQTVRYRKFPFLTNFSGLFNQIAYQIPIWGLAAFYGPQIAGFYLLAQRAAGFPSSLVGSSVSQVFFERAAKEIHQTGQSIQTYKKTLFLQTILSILPFAVLMIWGPRLFSLMFGKAWTQAGQICAILAPLFCIRFVLFPLSLVNEIHERQEIGLIWQVGLAFVSAVAFFGAGRYFHDINNVLKVFSAVLFLWYGVLLIITFHISGGRLKTKRLGQI